jgi:hypothetical protein
VQGTQEFFQCQLQPSLAWKMQTLLFF